MGIYALKPAFVMRLRRVEDRLVDVGVPADALTAAGAAAGCFTGTALAAGGLMGIPTIWFAVPFLSFSRLALNALDGSVARRTGTASARGAVANEVCDRVADAATIGALAFVVPPALALGALAGTLAASFVAVLALALTGHRSTTGPLGKADRVILIAAAATVAAAASTTTPFTVALWAIAIGTPITASVRVYRLWRDLDERS